MKRGLWFAGLAAVVIFGGAWGITALKPGTEMAQAVWSSAVIAFGTQLVSFAIALPFVKENPIAGWGLGALVRFAVVMVAVARAHARSTSAGAAPSGGANAIEAMILYIRDEVILPNVGHHGEGFVPYLLTAFFFILTLNLLGLVPYGSTATGNISVTATLAIMTFLTVEIAGIRANGLGYLNTIFYWNNELPMAMRPLMFLIMSPVEIIGKLTKPFALAIRLFANMTAGHIVVLALMGLIFTFGNLISGAPLLMAVLIMVLELFVAFLQAFIFTLLSSVFIGQIREAHH